MGQRIAIIGTGNVAASIAPAWISAGHSVVFGARDPYSRTARALGERLGEEVEIQTIARAIGSSRIALLAVTGSAAQQLVAEYADRLAGRIIIDATNHVAERGAERTAGERRTLSSAETIKKVVPDARVFRAFNHYGWEVFTSPVFEGRPATLFYCGPDDDTRETIEALIADIGLEPIWVGDLDQVDVVDNLITLWAALALRNNRGRDNVAFALLRR